MSEELPPLQYTANTGQDDNVQTQQFEVAQLMIGNGNGIVDFNQIHTYEQSLITDDERRLYLITLYDSIPAREFSKETLSGIGTHVRNHIVKNIKFIDNENTCGLSKSAIDRIRKFPSYWKPDLTRHQSLQVDIFKEFPDMINGTLYDKVQSWKGIRDKVLKLIRGHRNASQTSIQHSVLEGELSYFMLYVFM